jgi:hypothetical protein
MPQPTQQNVHVDAVLTNISIAYAQDESKFIASKVFPIVPVEKQSDKYFKYTKNDWFRDEAKRRADATESAGSGYNLGTDSYSCDVYAFHKDVGDKTRKNADNPLNLDAEAAKFVMGRILLRQEVQFVQDFIKTGVWGTDVTGVAAAPGANQFIQWDDYTNSDPIEDIEDGKEAILSTTGYMPNTLVIGYQVFRRLKNHPLFVDRVKYTTNDNITAAMIARMLELDNLYIAQAIKATNKEGATEAYSFIHGKQALLCYVNPTPGLLVPSAGYIFSWTGLEGDLGTPVTTSTIRMDLKKADRIETESAWDNKLVASDLGYFFDSVVS